MPLGFGLDIDSTEISHVKVYKYLKVFLLLT